MLPSWQCAQEMCASSTVIGTSVAGWAGAVAASGMFSSSVSSGSGAVFQSTDGGRTWSRILFRNDSTGVWDLMMDPTDPNTLYASFWYAYRTPWSLNSGGPGSGIMKTTDGGVTWRELTNNPGLPKGVLGKIGLTEIGREHV